MTCHDPACTSTEPGEFFCRRCGEMTCAGCSCACYRLTCPNCGHTYTDDRPGD